MPDRDDIFAIRGEKVQLTGSSDPNGLIFLFDHRLYGNFRRNVDIFLAGHVFDGVDTNIKPIESAIGSNQQGIIGPCDESSHQITT